VSSALFIVHTLRWRACPERISVARARCSSASRARTQVGRTDPAAHTATSSWCRPQCRHRGGWGSLQRGSRRAEPPPARRARCSRRVCVPGGGSGRTGRGLARRVAQGRRGWRGERTGRPMKSTPRITAMRLLSSASGPRRAFSASWIACRSITRAICFSRADIS